MLTGYATKIIVLLSEDRKPPPLRPSALLQENNRVMLVESGEALLLEVGA